MFYNSRHGGNLLEAEKLSGFKKNDIIDLSTNINPLGAPQKIFRYLENNIYDIERYPDLDYKKLYSSIERFSKLPIENIVVGNGASEIINLFVATVKPKKVLILHPTYGEYERECLKFNAHIDYYVPDNNIHDINELKQRFNKYNAVFLCNPNNPTGQIFPKVSLLEILPKTHDTWLFIDESFMDFVEDTYRYSLREFVSKSKIFILHSLTKIFAVPGLRIGCGYGPADLISNMRELQIPWSINSLASGAIQEILDDEKYVIKTRSEVAKMRDFAINCLEKIPAIKIENSVTNFLLLNISKTGFTSSLLQLELLKNKFLVRNANTFPGLKEDFIRIAIKDNNTMYRFAQTLEEVLKKGENT